MWSSTDNTLSNPEMECEKNQIVNLQVQTKQGSYFCLNQTITIEHLTDLNQIIPPYPDRTDIKQA